MKNVKPFVVFSQKIIQRVSSFEWLAALLVRLFVGYFFLETGWAKLQNLESFTAHFVQWGIPYPAFTAALSAYTEFIGGALTVLGLATRLASIPMIINMVVAIVTVKLKEVTGINDFVELDEPLYALAYFWLLIYGPGMISIDYLVSHLMRSTLAERLEQSESEPSRGHGVRMGSAGG